MARNKVDEEVVGGIELEGKVREINEDEYNRGTAAEPEEIRCFKVYPLRKKITRLRTGRE